MVKEGRRELVRRDSTLSSRVIICSPEDEPKQKVCFMVSMKLLFSWVLCRVHHLRMMLVGVLKVKRSNYDMVMPDSLNRKGGSRVLKSASDGVLSDYVREKAESVR